MPATVCAIAGTTAPGTDGVSLVPLLTQAQMVREGSYITPPDRLTWEGVRKARYKYIEYTDGFRELYDLQTDPFELQNVAGPRRHGDSAAADERIARASPDLTPTAGRVAHEFPWARDRLPRANPPPSAGEARRVVGHVRLHLARRALVAGRVRAVGQLQGPRTTSW